MFWVRKNFVNSEKVHLNTSFITNQKNEDQKIMVEAFSDSEKKAEATLTYYKDPPKAEEKLSSKDKARQRWKILCLVKVRK